MAQRVESVGRRVNKRFRRLGIGGKVGAVVACVAFVALLGLVGLARVTGSAGLTIERDDGLTTSTTNTAEAQSEEADPKTADAVREEDDAPEVQEVYVHVDGAVAKPGVYRLTGTEPRVNDAVAMAGGLTSDADTSLVNLASVLADGQKIYIPLVGEEPPAQADQSTDVDVVVPDESAGLININVANNEELQALPGVGEATAAAILDDRERNGSFASVEDIMRVSGIGEKKFQKIKDMICV